MATTKVGVCGETYQTYLYVVLYLSYYSNMCFQFIVSKYVLCMIYPCDLQLFLFLIRFYNAT